MIIDDLLILGTSVIQALPFLTNFSKEVLSGPNSASCSIFSLNIGQSNGEPSSAVHCDTVRKGDPR